jgi:hypothetical protein
MSERDQLQESLLWCSSTERPYELLRAFADPENDGSRFWRIVAAEWSGFDRIPHRDYANAFRRYRPSWTVEALCPEARAVFDNLPSILTIYRGQDWAAPIGLAWTLDRSVAEGFARGHRGLWNKQPALFTVRVRKTSVALVCVDRRESEVVLFRPPTVVRR